MFQLLFAFENSCDPLAGPTNTNMPQPRAFVVRRFAFRRIDLEVVLWMKRLQMPNSVALVVNSYSHALTASLSGL
jgi:hypothetical protein